MSEPAIDRLVVSGASGWLGSHLVRRSVCRTLTVGTYDARREARLEIAGGGSTAFVHLAAIAHRGGHDIACEEYFKVNRDLAVSIARQSREAGVRRFVFASTAAMMPPSFDRPWIESDTPRPSDSYSEAKLQAERSLLELVRPGVFDVVVLRPPLIWGPGVRANFRALIKLARSPWPLPLGKARLPRSSLFLENAVDAFLYAATAPSVGSGVYFLADDVDLAPADWIARLRKEQGRSCGLFDLSPSLLQLGARVVGREGIWQRLFTPLQVDPTKFRRTGWRPPVGLESALAETVAWYGGSR